MRLRGVYNYTEAVLKEPSAKVDFARLNWISGCVVKRTERFGKDLKLYADASGDRVDSSGKTVKFGKEKTSVKTIASPKIGKTYKLVTNFKYYYGLSTLGNIHGSVTYQLSHNGKTYWKDLLMTYLEDERCSFNNNLSENVIRLIRNRTKELGYFVLS